MDKIICEECGEGMGKNGLTNAGSQRYRCKNGHSYTEGAKPRGNKPIGDKAMSSAERVREHRRRKAEKAQES